MASRSSFFDDTPFPQSLHEKRCNSICSLLPDSLVVDMRIHVARRTAPITVFMPDEFFLTPLYRRSPAAAAEAQAALHLVVHLVATAAVED
mmetsp:Transcript_23176/g.39478  ORF Transcript_23176/g.39478 Transcript_23176/m.39478 type:complete len:91 (-) Transcript_23176:204-476(-)